MSSRYFVGIFLFFGFILSSLFCTPRSFAVTVSIISAPTTITQDNFTVAASISGAQAGTNYLRIDLYKNGTTNYFGDTYNGTSWYNGSDGTQYFPVTVPVTSAVELKGRIGNPTTTQFDATGSYQLRIRRYTTSGNPGSNDTIDSVGVTILVPTSTPQPKADGPLAQTPTSTPPTPTPLPKLPTHSASSVFSIPSPTSSQSHYAYPTIIPLITNNESTFGAVLGTNASVAPTPIISGQAVVAAQADHKEIIANALPVLFILIGFGLLASCGILIALQTEKGKAVWKKFF